MRTRARKSKKGTHDDLFVAAARAAVRRAGWDPRSDIEFLRPDGSAVPEGVRYGYRSDRVRLRLSDPLLDQLSNTLRTIEDTGTSKPIDALAAVVGSRVYLQIGSFKVCPYSAYDYAALLEACADGMRSAGASDQNVSTFYIPVTSFFIASVISGVYGIEGPAPRSFRQGWLLDHINTSLTNDHTLPTYAAVYINIQLRLWCNDSRLADSVRACFPVSFDALEFETDRGTAILLDSFEFVDREEDGIAWSDQRTRNLIIDELKYKWRDWSIKAFQFAEMLAPYIVPEQGDRRFPPPPSSPWGNHENRGRRPSDDARQRMALITGMNAQNTSMLLNQDEVSAQQLPDTPVDLFAEQFAESPAFRQRVLQSCVNRGSNPLSYHLGFDALDALYRSRATDLSIEGDAIRRSGTALEIAHMSREVVDNGPLNFNEIDWGATRISPDTDLQFYRKRLPITSQSPACFEMEGFPDLLLVVDSSGSMGWDPNQGIGAYDSLLRAIYSVLGFLEKNQKAQYMRFAVVNFSSSTLRTSWHSYCELNKIKTLLFRHQGGGTQLDCSVLQQVADTCSDRYLCIMVSDAVIGNVPEVINTIRRMTDHGHGFVLIQIGKAVPMTTELEKSGHSVHMVTNHRDLEGLCIEYARKTWGQ